MTKDSLSTMDILKRQHGNYHSISFQVCPAYIIISDKADKGGRQTGYTTGWNNGKAITKY